MATKKPRSTEGLSTLDDFLDEEGARDAFQAVAIKEVLAYQIEQAMKAQKLSRRRLAERMGTSRSQIGRLLDPNDGNVTLATLQRARNARAQGPPRSCLRPRPRRGSAIGASHSRASPNLFQATGLDRRAKPILQPYAQFHALLNAPGNAVVRETRESEPKPHHGRGGTCARRRCRRASVAPSTTGSAARSICALGDPYLVSVVRRIDKIQYGVIRRSPKT